MRYFSKYFFLLPVAVLILGIVIVTSNPINVTQAASVQGTNQITKNLFLGITDSQVIALQQILNKDPATQVAVSGIGSPGHESSYFGSLTQRAVINFQQKYASVILVPAGLFRGNGFVGPLTIKKLNAVANTGLLDVNNNVSIPFVSPSVSVTTNPTSGVNPAAVLPFEKIDIYATDKQIATLKQTITATVNTALINKINQTSTSTKVNLKAAVKGITPSRILIQKLSVNTGLVGSSLTIYGTGFNSDNTVYFGDSYVVRKISGISGITIKVPNIPPGKYDVVVKNSAGLSNSQTFIITTPNSPKVSITRAVPTEVKYGQVVTIYGTGFTPTNNQITTKYGEYKGLPSSDGTTLTFTFAPEIFKVLSTIGKGTKSYPLSVMVVNDNGYANIDNLIKFVY